MRTVALTEGTFQMLKMLKEKKQARSFDELISKMVLEEEKIPKSMFGALKGKAEPFTRKERLEMWNDRKRGL